MIFEPHSYYHKILKHALCYYGNERQLKQSMEEAGELVAACNHFMRKERHNSRYELITEIADNYIMLEQLCMIVGEEDVYEEIQHKLERLKDRIGIVSYSSGMTSTSNISS